MHNADFCVSVSFKYVVCDLLFFYPAQVPEQYFGIPQNMISIKMTEKTNKNHAIL